MHNTLVEYARVLAEVHNITITEAMTIIAGVLEITNQVGIDK